MDSESATFDPEDVEVEAEEVRKLEDEEDSATPRVIKVKVPKVREKFTDSSSIFRRDSGKWKKWGPSKFCIQALR